MAVTTRGYSLLKCLYLVPILLASIAQVASGQNYQNGDNTLTLTGPDVENMMTCAMPHPEPLDTQVNWYVNGQKIKVVFLPHDTASLYESLEEFTDLLGDYPRTVQCTIDDDMISWDPVISNVVTLVPS